MSQLTIIPYGAAKVWLEEHFAELCNHTHLALEINIEQDTQGVYIHIDYGE